jgi:hypothetical protein
VLATLLRIKRLVDEEEMLKRSLESGMVCNIF